MSKTTEPRAASSGGGGGVNKLLALLLIPLLALAAYSAVQARSCARGELSGVEHATASRFWSVYRYGEVRYVHKAPGDTVAVIVERAREVFADDKITTLRSHTGRLLNALSDLAAEREPGFIICLGDEDLFMWPALRVGEIVKTKVTPDVNPGSFRELAVRTVSVRPRVFEIPNFLSEEECDHLVQIARSAQLARSKVGGDTGDKGEYRDVRTSSQTWISTRDGDQQNTPVVRRIRKRVFDLTKMSEDVGEPMQLVHYNVSQHYMGHHDYAHKWESTDNPWVQAGGNRYVTVIYYLNHVKAGGQTAFPFGNSSTTPELDASGNEKIWVTRNGQTVYYGYPGCDGKGLVMPPVKGSALVFYNLHEKHTWDALPDSYTLHAGCDVLEGEKYMANQWIRNRRIDGKLYDGRS